MFRRLAESRWMVVFGAVLMQLSLGSIYAWSVFTPTLIHSGWSRLQTQIVFAASLATIAIVMLFAGRLLRRFGPRKLAMLSGLVLGSGYVLMGLLGPTSFPVAVMCIGIVGGTGIGLGYVVPIAVGIRWFPKNKGMITGLAVAGFGFGALGWVKLAGSWGNLIAQYGIATTFITYGMAFATLILTGSVWMRMPQKARRRADGSHPAKVGAHKRSYHLREMLATPQFYMLFTIFAVSAGAGLMSVGLMKLYPAEALMAHGMDPLQASAMAGTAIAVFFSLANGIGRIVWGVVSDRLGRLRSVLILTASQSVFLFAFPYMAGTPALLFLGAALIGFNFGGNFSLFPALTADMFGAKRVGQNYPYVFFSSGVGGIVFPVLGGVLGDMGNFPLAFTITALACGAGALLAAFVRMPVRTTVTRQALRPVLFIRWHNAQTLARRP